MLVQSQAAVDPQNLPLWMVYFAFWASLILGVFKIVEFAVRATRFPRLDARLTSDVFFRLTDFGESLFCNSILLSFNGPVLITSTRVTLTKTDSAVKVFPFAVLLFGEKVKGSGPLAEHFFPTASSIRHIAALEPQTVLYMCVQQQYRDASQRAIYEFRKEVLNYKQELLQSAASAPLSNQQSLQQDALRRLTELVEAHLPGMMELVQLEPGKYKLLLQVDYRNPQARVLHSVTKTAQSSITFVIGTEVRDLFRVNLRQALLQTATTLILDQQMFIPYPEYQPLEVKVA
jgi:hypothetical protein